jgi:hypothetical protein
MRPFFYYLSLLILAASSIGIPAYSANLNPSFDNDLAGWGLEPAASPTWDPMDVNDSQESGSARLTMTGDPPGTQGILQYVAVEPGAQYELSAWIQVGGDTGVGGSARLFGWWYRQLDGSRCSDNAGSLATIPSVMEDEAGEWVFRKGVVTAPLDAHCALVKGAIYKTEDTGEFIAYYDEFYFKEATAVGLNIDFGTFFSEPTSDYGAAAGQDGSWNRAGLGVTALVDTFGLPSGASVNVTADDGTGYIGSTPSNDDEELLQDNFYSGNGNSWSANLSGLASGTYDVFLYAPSNSSVPTGDMTVGGVAVPSIPGNSGSTLIEGTSWVSVQVTVTDGTLMISGAGTSYSGLAGIQIVSAQEVEGIFYHIRNKKVGAAVIYLE